jgi:autotransporter-associated beta strand protein
MKPKSNLIALSSICLFLATGIPSTHAAILGTPGAIQVEYTLGESGADFVNNFQDASGNNRNMVGGAGVDYAVGTTTWTTGPIAASGSTASLMSADGKAKWTMSNAAGISTDYQVTIFVDASDDWPNPGTAVSAQTIFSMDGISFTRQGGNYAGVVNGTTLGTYSAGTGWHQVGLMFQKINDVFSFWISTNGGASWTQQGGDLTAVGLGDDWGSSHLFVKPGGGENYWGYADAFAVRSVTLPPAGGDLTWDNGTSNFIWSTSANNWSGSPWNNTNLSNAIFNSTGSGAVTLDQPILLGNMTVNASGYSFTGSTLSFNSSVLTINQPVTIGSTLAGNGLTKQGAGTLTLNGAPGYSGLTTVSQGSLIVGSGGTLGSVTLDAGTSLTTAANASALTISGNITMNNGATLAATGTPAPIFGNVFFSNNNQQVIVTGDTQSTISAEFHLAESHTFQVADGLADTDLLVSGILSNHDGSHWGAVVKTGDGTLRLSSGANLHGGNFLAGGTLVFTSGSLGLPQGPWSLARFTGAATLRWDVGNTQDISTDGELAINDGVTATLDTNGNDVTLGTPITVESARSAGLIKNGAGTLTLAAAQTYIGNTTVSSGTLVIGSGGSLRFRPTSNGNSNLLSGSGTHLSIDGAIHIELDGAEVANENSWSLIDVGSFAGPSPFQSGFHVTSNLGDFEETSAGVWTKPDGANTWTFSESTGVLSVAVTASDYDTWAGPSGYNLSGGMDADDDNDGLTNHEEYAFGLIPNSGASSNPITAQLNKTTGTFTYTRRDPVTKNTGLTYTIWTSTNLVDWTLETDLTAVQTPGAPDGNGIQSVVVTLTPAPTAPKFFVQVRAN